MRCAGAGGMQQCRGHFRCERVDVGRLLLSAWQECYLAATSLPSQGLAIFAGGMLADGTFTYVYLF